MAYGDTHYSFLTSGSTATSAATAHLLFGMYQGLSTFGENEVVNINLVPTGTDARVGNPVSNNTGLRLAVAASNFDLPPMRIGAASRLLFNREGSTDTTVLWAVWRRVPFASG